METTRSPLELMRRAYQLGKRLWSDHASRFSRQDFTRPQLFACLVMRESLQLSYRKTEAFLWDVPGWLIELEMKHVPDHNTLWRAFGQLLKKKHVEHALDLFAEDEKKELNGDLSVMPLTMDSTCYEPRHRSRHYDRVCRRMMNQPGEKDAKGPGKYGEKVNASRSKKLKRMPKLALAAAAASHRILAIKAGIGHGSDAPDFVPLLDAACRRAKVRVVVADSGYDSESNHCHSRGQLKVRSIIPAQIGRPTIKAPTGRHRRNMKNRFARRADAKPYGQRAQSETINSMMKRNLGEYLRSIRPRRQNQELCLRPIVHNLMLGPEKREG
jgi:Transposase DDE domain